MKFVADNGSIVSIRGDLKTAIAYNNASLSLRKRSKEASGVFLADLDARIDDKSRPEPQGDLEKFWVAKTAKKFTFINRNLSHELKGPLIETANVKPVAQRQRKISQERANKVAKQAANLLEARFIRELEYLMWLSNVVLIKKANGRWRMCVDYSDLNKPCPKDSFPS
ncbi:uncharacterized protein [Arachis hypogaea]|uniref:uncharacterized protein n=1 Tax=Arachis hypogaea TaxID=3818 RepID=UPI000DEC1EF6|nr:uncharacterized protein LOC112779312 [Arachis hypogaea]